MKFTRVKQHDATDCAAACLATVSIYYGREVTVSKLRDICGTDIKGTSINGIIEGALQLGFDAKAVRVTAESLKTQAVTLPLIAHIINENGMSHFIVVYKITKDKLFIADPAKNNKTISFGDFEKMYDGIL